MGRSARPAPFTEGGELTSVGRMLAVRTGVLALMLVLVGFAVGEPVPAIVLAACAVAIPLGGMLYLRRRIRQA